MPENHRPLKSIAVVTCWYGPFPWYFPYFVLSCNYNPTIDFIIVTDNTGSIPNSIGNIKIVNKSLEEVNAVAKEKLGFDVNIESSYKLCDFKPTYGLLFSDILKDYDFWGHADIDIVYGDIRSFMTEELLDTHDVISSRHDYITGSFCLFRNNEKMNTLFMESKDHTEVLSSKYHYCFDECNFLCEELREGASIFDYPDRIQSMTWVVKKAQAEGRLNAFFDFIIVEGNPGKVKWDRGRIIYKDTYEAMFYHLIVFKATCVNPRIPDPIPETLYFTPKKVMTYKK